MMPLKEVPVRLFPFSAEGQAPCFVGTFLFLGIILDFWEHFSLLKFVKGVSSGHEDSTREIRARLLRCETP